jgi:hypothetical protein
MRLSGSNATTPWRLYRLKGLALHAIAAVAVFAAAQVCAQAPVKSGGQKAQAPAVEQAPAPQEAPAAKAAQKPADAAAPADPAKSQVADECADLLKLAKELKAAMEKTDSNQTLSLGVLRKAGQIKELAHKIRQQAQPVAEKK